MSSALIWIIIGVVLIISELLATSVIAVFLGIGAIVTGILLQFGIIESSSAQYIVFGSVSLIMLLTARGKFKRWFRGYTANAGEHGMVFQKDLGERVTVHTTFVNGAGRVVLNGVQWDAYSDDALEKGDVAWVERNEGIKLKVTKTKLSQ
ncbi:NfeD family protein [Aliidiomarina haloalkalitolerans]|uniref:Peptidase n=1 Tax=Aliidiomarina haloalkalitolerans TaxID=859059 RepID=A0A432VY74_9GAMM|nr:NfeD family protein [Aliidiomarina haloalkalitolerans]RUO21663.1 peptidase [Aliidiomarina haloalkalitolerans]